MNDKKTNEKSGKKHNQNQLSDFISENHMSISILGVFIALTVFTANLSIVAFSYVLSFLFLTLSLTIWIDLLEKFPAGLAQWRLHIFEVLLSLAFLGVVVYWFVSYRELWQQIMFLPITMILTSIIMYFVTLPIKKYDIFNKLFKTKPNKLKAIRHSFFFILIFSVFYFCLWLSKFISPPINFAIDWFYNEVINWIPAR